MHISEKLARSRAEGKPTFSFEFFPPKTAQVRHIVAQMPRKAQ
jgi:methylenetetrahydrofolate reductase (NADPH)